MDKIHIIGTGGLAKEVISYIESEKNRVEIIGCWGDKNFNNDLYKKYYKGDIEDFKKKYSINEYVLIAIADNSIRKRVVQSELKELNINYYTYIHPSCEISKNSKIGIGCMICPSCIIRADATIGDFNFLNTHCAIGHDTVLGSYNCLFPKVEICGDCSIGTNCTFGTNSIVLPGVKLDSNSQLDSMSVLGRSSKVAGFYFGNPARLIKSS